MEHDSEIVAVTGFPRSGTSLVMQMLKAGGMSLYYDKDSDVSFETWKSQQLPKSHGWLKECRGRAVKILDPAYQTPPPVYRYAFIWLERDVQQQALSYSKFLRWASGGRIDAQGTKRLARSLQKDRPKWRRKLAGYPNSRLLSVRFETLLASPKDEAVRIAEFIGGMPLDADAMAAVVVRRPPECLPYMLEERLVRAGNDPVAGGRQ